MARPPQFERQDDFQPNLATLKDIVRSTAAERANLLAWLLLYFDDRGELFSPQMRRGRQRIRLDDVGSWLAKVPKRKK